MLEKIGSAAEKGMIPVISRVTLLSPLAIASPQYVLFPVVPGGEGGLGAAETDGCFAFPRQRPGQPRQAGRGAPADRPIRRPAGCRSWERRKSAFVPLPRPRSVEGDFPEAH